MNTTQDSENAINGISSVGGSTPISNKINEENSQEWQKWLDFLEHILEVALKDQAGPERAPYIMDTLIKRLRKSGVPLPAPVSTPYINTIPASEETDYPGDRERRR